MSSAIKTIRHRTVYYSDGTDLNSHMHFDCYFTLFFLLLRNEKKLKQHVA